MSSERGYSKLKLKKTYLRNTIGQERLSDLALISIEKELVWLIDFEKAVDAFATVKSRRLR